MPYPHAAENHVIVRVHTDGHPASPGHELSGVVVELGYGTTGLTVGQRCSDYPQRIVSVSPRTPPAGRASTSRPRRLNCPR
ncbi:alcohol dehydrogenase catalytic domain-containing protein [Actinopolymorpha singaporensis]|uniref:alcohol dehydrogenase catalytic domain-containing protein n=1 Tax=Actinopolymorpha singaporensis TaxID=117157 RepID=UPI003BAE8903